MDNSHDSNEPVAWIEHEWSGTGLRHLHFERREPTVRDELVNPVWTPLYTSPPAQRKPLTDEQRMEMWSTTKFRGSGGQFDWFIEGTRAAEAAHGIKEQP